MSLASRRASNSSKKDREQQKQKHFPLASGWAAANNVNLWIEAPTCWLPLPHIRARNIGIKKKQKHSPLAPGWAADNNVKLRFVTMNMVLPYVGAMAGDGRQRAEERMGNKNKNNTLKHSKTLSQNEKTQCSSTLLITKRLFSLHLANSARSDGHLRHFPREWMTDRRRPWADRLGHDLQGLNLTTANQGGDLTRPGPEARRFFLTAQH